MVGARGRGFHGIAKNNVMIEEPRKTCEQIM